MLGPRRYLRINTLRKSRQRRHCGHERGGSPRHFRQRRARAGCGALIIKPRRLRWTARRPSAATRAQRIEPRVRAHARGPCLSAAFDCVAGKRGASWAARAAGSSSAGDSVGRAAADERRSSAPRLARVRLWREDSASLGVRGRATQPMGIKASEAIPWMPGRSRAACGSARACDAASTPER